jgi:hypothetical protein
MSALEFVCAVIMAVSACGIVIIGLVAEAYERRIKEQGRAIHTLRRDLCEVSDLLRGYYRANRDLQQRLALAGALVAGMLAGMESVGGT